MGRQHMKSMPDSVYKLVVAEVGDYDRKKEALEKGDLPREKIIEYSRKLAAIDTAISSACSGEGTRAKTALMFDIANLKGYNNGLARQYYLTKGIYMRRKREAMTSIARILELL